MRRKFEVVEGIPHLDINGPPGVGKTTVLIALFFLLEKLGYRAHFIYRYYTRDPRPGEVAPEYRFVRLRNFLRLVKKGFFIDETIQEIKSEKEEDQKHLFLRAIPKMENWSPLPEGGADVVISLLGRYGVKFKQQIPGMKSVYISCLFPETIERRLRERCRALGIDPTRKLKSLKEYNDQRLWESYDHVIFNDGTPEECAIQILILAGLLDPLTLQKTPKT